MDAIQIRSVRDSFKSMESIADQGASMSNHCPLEGTRHYPCGLMHEEEECEFRCLCSQMQEDSNRFLRSLGAAVASEVQSAWTQTYVLLANTMKEAATANALPVKQGREAVARVTA